MHAQAQFEFEVFGVRGNKTNVQKQRKKNLNNNNNNLERYTLDEVSDLNNIALSYAIVRTNYACNDFMNQSKLVLNQSVN